MKKLEDSLKFKEWTQSLLKNGVHIEDIDVLNTIHKPNGEVLFGLIDVDAVDEEGKKILPIVLLRGHFVIVLVCLIEKETFRKYCLLVKQRRIADGSMFYEHPAGMCDSESDPYKVALKEVWEETGLQISRESLVLLNDKLLYSSPGLLDEGGYFFACEISLTTKEIESFKNQKMGDTTEHEYITTYICSFEESFDLIKNTSGLLVNYLYLNHTNKK
ncbi:MAG: NUDIX hydrolase [Leptospiraceae bacterium]|nr:NUDIX hydrolase [Leptospiraceae bacterium]MCP5494773.1 NUDIX hydrolase [Leptospiraceae bacterium]